MSQTERSLPIPDEAAPQISGRGQPAGAVPASGQVREVSKRNRSPLLWMTLAIAVGALLVAVFSLVVNGLLIQRLLAARETGQGLVDAAIQELDEVLMDEVAFSYVFSDTIAYSGTVPISQTIQFPFRGTVPFQGNVPFQGVVPVVINIPLIGGQRINVPVNTTVYVDTSVDVSTTVTVPVAMDFPFAVEMPVELPIDIEMSLDDQPGLKDMFAGIRQILVELRALIGE